LNSKRLDDLEMHELLRLIYPDHIKSDDDECFELSQYIGEQTIDLGDGVEVDLFDFLGRVVMLTVPMQSGLTGTWSHCLGKVEVSESTVNMIAAVRRNVEAAKAARGE
jgi:hypothetical protein